MTTAMKFPKRFEIEKLDPMTLKVKVVGMGQVNIYDNMEQAGKILNFMFLAGPMADKHEGQWCVRFETFDANKRMSA